MQAVWFDLSRESLSKLYVSNCKSEGLLLRLRISPFFFGRVNILVNICPILIVSSPRIICTCFIVNICAMSRAKFFGITGKSKHFLFGRYRKQLYTFWNGGDVSSIRWGLALGIAPFITVLEVTDGISEWWSCQNSHSGAKTLFGLNVAFSKLEKYHDRSRILIETRVKAKASAHRIINFWWRKSDLRYGGWF